MGFFSWITSDTNRSIPANCSNRKTFPVHMITKDGQIFTENDYEGYGEFGGKDIYVLAAEMNGQKGATDEETRQKFFDNIWKRGIEKDGKKLFYRDDFTRYDEPIASEGGLSANTLSAKHGWNNFGDGGEFHLFALAGFNMPKLVEKLPNKDNWVAEWDNLPYPASCPDQGYFYCDDEDGEEYADEID